MLEESDDKSLDLLVHQNLYFIYHFDLFLQRLIHREANFTLLFLTKNKRFYKSQSLLFIRELIIKSLRNDTKNKQYNIELNDTEWYLKGGDSFEAINDFYHNRNFSFLLCLPPFINERLVKLYDIKAIKEYMMKSTCYFSHFVDVLESDFRGSNLHSFIYTFRKNKVFSKSTFLSSNVITATNKDKDVKIDSVLKEVVNELAGLPNVNYKSMLILSPLVYIIRSNKPLSSALREGDGYLLKVASIYLVLLQSLPISQRVFNIKDHYPSSVTSLFDQASLINNQAIGYVNSIVPCTYKLMSMDIFDIKLFIFVSLIMSSDEQSWLQSFGEQLLRKSQEYLDIINKAANTKFSVLSESLSNAVHGDFSLPKDEISQILQADTLRNMDFSIYNVDNPFITQVLGDIREPFQYSTTIPQNIKDLHEGEEFYDITHRHSLRLLKELPDAFMTKLKDDYKLKGHLAKRYSEKAKQGSSHKYYRFAETLYDVDKKFKITELNKDKPKDKKEKVNYQVNKQSKNKSKQLKKDFAPEKEKKNMDELIVLHDTLKESKSADKMIRLLLAQVSESSKSNYCDDRLDIYTIALKKLKKKNRTMYEPEKHRKHLFQLLQKYLRDFDDGKLQGLKTNHFAEAIYHVSLLLNLYNFSAYVNKRFKLNQTEKEKENVDPGKELLIDNSIYFQMCRSQDTLVRSTDSKADGRVRFFEPDGWQRELLDVVDANESALVCAPTSSGKTFISFYILERVLRESNDGIAVYVSPTKALVNQMFCEIIARFEKKYENIVGNNEAGKYSMAGIFTRDYRINVDNCQVLVTVPQCLDLLFLSITNTGWLNRIKYVIFDEVHQIANSVDGAIWEQLLLYNPAPFVALSATLGNIKDFHQWLQDIIPERKVRVVNHTQRFNDLKTYNYNTKSHDILPHHPCMAIKVNNSVQELSMLSEEAVGLYRVISKRYQHDNDSQLDLKALDPLVYFDGDNNIYNMNKQDISAYQNQLKKFLQDRSESNEYRQIVHVDYKNHDVNTGGWVLKFPKILDNLKKRNMLPVLVFCLNRSLCEKLAYIVKDYIDKKYDNPEKKEKIRVLKNFIRNLVAKLKDRYMPDEEREALQAELNVQNAALSRLTTRKAEYGTIIRDDVYDPKGVLNTYGMMRPLLEGVGVHHSGLNRNFLDNVEFLFRKKKIEVVIATGSLAMGINAPTRTVIIAGDSPYLNTLSFRQMSGRAGRRGFEDRGHIVMLGVSETKVNKLINSKLSQIVGNSVLSPSLVLRILCRYNYTCVEEKENLDALVQATKRIVDRSFFLRKSPNQNRLLFTFSTDLLYRRGFISAQGQAIGYAGIISHLSYLEPYNFTFIELLRANAFDKFVRPSKHNQMEIVSILCYIFNQKKLPNNMNVKNSPSKIQLPPLPDVARECFEKNNQVVIETFAAYLCQLHNMSNKPGKDEVSANKFLDQWKETTSKYIEKPRLRKHVQAIGGSPNTISSIKRLSSSLPPNTFFDISVLPLVDLNCKKRNSYLLDFFKHNQLKTIIEVNGINEGDLFEAAKDFAMTVKTIAASLIFRDPSSPVAIAFQSLASTLQATFVKAFDLENKPRKKYFANN